MSSVVVTTAEDGLAVLTVSRPEVRNALSEATVREVHGALEQLASQAQVRALVITGAGDKAFVSGADIEELAARDRLDALRRINSQLFRAVEMFPVATIAAVRGFALGGGCELALACDLRVCGKSSRWGQPEVSLGILPGAGATYRLPRLVGLGRAKDLVLTGRIIGSDEALAMGLVNRVVEDNLVLEEAQKLAREIMAQSTLAVRLAKMALNASAEASTDVAMALESTAQAVLFEDAEKKERMAAFPEKTQGKEVVSKTRKLAVLGAGTMGHGIAQIAAQAGLEVRLYDVAHDALARALVMIGAALDGGVKRGKLTQEQRDTALARIRKTTNLREAVEDADVIIEAVPEKIDLKRKIVAEVTRFAPEDALLGTNTSSLPVREIAAAAVHPWRVLGMHFFNPPHIVKLMEIVRCEQTSESALRHARDVGTLLEREMIVVSDTPGFATSRLGLVIGLEAIRMLEANVASAEDIDRAMELGYRHPMGPLRLTDLVGLDVQLAIAEHLHREIGKQFEPPELLRRMVQEGKLGKKSGQGFYTWPAGS